MRRNARRPPAHAHGGAREQAEVRLVELYAAGADVSGRARVSNYDLAELARYIDWTPFFQTWELAGPYPIS